MKKILLVLGGVLLVLVLIIIGVAAYFGFIPGISDNLVQRVDLGIENDRQLSIDLREKSGVEFNIPESEWPTEKEIAYSGTLNIDESLSSEQITSILNIVSEELASMPFSNVQIRINEDGTAEASFNLNIDTTANEAKKLGYTDAEIEEGKKYVGVLGDSVYMYAKLSVEVVNNDLTVVPYAFRIQNFNVPSAITEKVAEIGSAAIEDRLSQVPSLNIDSLTQEGSKLHFVGTIPKTVNTVD